MTEQFTLKSDVDDLQLGRRHFMRAGAVLATTVAAAGGITLANSKVARAQTYDPNAVRFAFSTPFSGQDSFTGTIGGLRNAVGSLGGELTIADASFDLRRQVDQIAAIVASQPDIFICLPVDPVGCANAIQAALDAEIPSFILDTTVPGVAVTQASFHDNFGMGVVTGTWMAERLGGSGKVGAMQLPINETWNMRDMGMAFALQNYPDIELVATWAFDPTGRVTPRAAADSMLTAHPDLDAIWTAWDNAGMEAALAVLAAGKGDRVFTTGIDGGAAAFEAIRSGGPFKFTCTQSFYAQAAQPVYYAHQFLQGNPVPRTLLHPSYAISIDELEGRDEELVSRYDEPGVAEQLGWVRVL